MVISCFISFDLLFQLVLESLGLGPGLTSNPVLSFEQIRAGTAWASCFSLFFFRVSHLLECPYTHCSLGPQSDIGPFPVINSADLFFASVYNHSACHLWAPTHACTLLLTRSTAGTMCKVFPPLPSSNLHFSTPGEKSTSWAFTDSWWWAPPTGMA